MAYTGIEPAVNLEKVLPSRKRRECIFYSKQRLYTITHTRENTRENKNHNTGNAAKLSSRLHMMID